MSRNGDAAAQYARAGWPVFPARPSRADCPAPGSCACKAPLTRHGVDDATSDPLAVQRYWDRQPEANVAIATGGPGPVVLDVDVAHGRPGYASLNEAIRAGLVPQPMATVRTPSGGLHLYYEATPAQRSGSMPDRGLDWRAERGYVLAPPSAVHGRPYVLVSRQASQATIDSRGCATTSSPQPLSPRGSPATASATPRA
jgi:Bifunctional DNA primase/polymerase, N-terminal